MYDGGVPLVGADNGTGNGSAVTGGLINAGGLFSGAGLLNLVRDGLWKGANGKWNDLLWGGNQWTGARSKVLERANQLRAAGQGLFVLGGALSAYQGYDALINDDFIGVGRSVVDFGVGTAATFGGAVGLVGGASYFGTSALVEIPVVRDFTVTPIVDQLCSFSNC